MSAPDGETGGYLQWLMQYVVRAKIGLY